MSTDHAAAVHTPLALPDDAAELLAWAQLEYPELTAFRHCSDAVVAQNALHQHVHMTHRSLRDRVKAMSDAVSKARGRVKSEAASESASVPVDAGKGL